MGVPAKTKKKRGTLMKYEPKEPPVWIVPRSYWTSQPFPVEEGFLDHPCEEVLITHTEGANLTDRRACLARIYQLHKRHIVMGLGDIAYNFLVSDDGTLYEGRGWDIKPRRIRPEPDEDIKLINYLQIALIGTFGDGTEYPEPSLELITSLKELFHFGFEKGHIIEEGYLLKDLSVSEDETSLTSKEELK